MWFPWGGVRTVPRMKKMNDEGILNLISAAAKSAVRDYKDALDTKRRLSGRVKCDAVELAKAEKTIKDCERFFRGTLFTGAFPHIDPEMIIREVRRYDF